MSYFLGGILFLGKFSFLLSRDTRPLRSLFRGVMGSLRTVAVLHVRPSLFLLLPLSSLGG